MSYTSNYNLNQRISYLESIIAGLIPFLPINLANTLLGGDNAGASDIDMNNNDILNVDNMNTNAITNCNSITTPLNNQYSKEQVVYLTTNITAPTGSVESNLRFNAFSLGKDPEWLEATSVSTTGFVSGVENITASQDSWNGYFWVGTDVGNVYYSNDGGLNWTLQGSYGGRIRCFCPYNGGTYMAVGGDFSTVFYNYLLGIDTFNNSFDITISGTGMNAPVYAFYDNASNSCLYIGGAFDDFYGILSANYPKWITLDYSTSTFYSFSNVSGNGFFSGDVLTITQDITTSGFIVVGGNFTSASANSSPIPIPYILTFITSTGFNLIGHFGIGLALNNGVSSVLQYGNYILVGGSFSNTAGYGMCGTNYGIQIYWNGVNWDIDSYPFFIPSSSIRFITFIAPTGVYYTNVGGNTIFGSSTQYLPIPIGSLWECVAYNGTNTLFATDEQIVAGFLFYYYDQNVGITINGGGNVFRNQSSSISTNCFLTNINSAVEMMWNSTLNCWFVVSNEGCFFS